MEMCLTTMLIQYAITRQVWWWMGEWWVIRDIFKPRVEAQRLLPSKHYAFHNVRTMLVQRRRQWVNFAPTLLKYRVCWVEHGV